MESESSMDSQEAAVTPASASASAVKKHVRPTVRSRNANANANALGKSPTSSTTTPAMVPPVPVPAHHDHDLAVEETRQRIETWVGIQPSKAEIDTETETSNMDIEQQVPNKHKQPQSNGNPSGILRPPKYSGQSESAIVEDDNEGHESHKDQDQPRPTPVVRDVVMERPKRKAQSQRQAAATSTSSTSPASNLSRTRADPTAIEGYTPTTMPTISTKAKAKTSFAADTKQSSSETPSDDDDPLVFNSLADLMETAGTLPPNDWNDPTQPPAVVEAELSFSCMDPDDYKEQLEEEDDEDEEEEEEEREEEPQVDGNDDDDDDDDDIENETSQDDGGGGFLNDFFSNEDDEEPVERREERAFLTLWKAIAHWVTPESVQYVTLLHERQQQGAESGQLLAWDNEYVPQVDRSDVGASRCAGLMALLQMHIPRCLQELGRSMEERRTAERRLADLLRCWDYGRPAAVKLGTKLARALTCVLLETVLMVPGLEDPVKLPVSCQAVDMKVEEYRYLTRSAILSFGASSVAE
jgi:hypothetical protein